MITRVKIEVDELQRQPSPLRIFYPVQAFLIIGIIVEAVRRRLNYSVSRGDRGLAALRETNAEASLRIAEVRFEVQIQIVSGGHNHCGIVLQFSRETRDRPAHRRVSISYKNVILMRFEIQVLDLETTN